MRIHEGFRKVLETAALSLAIAAVNLLFPGNPGFADIFFLPYVSAAVFLSVYYGRRYGLISLAASAVFIAGPYPFILQIIYSTKPTISYWNQLMEASYIPVPVSLAFIYLFGMTRAGYIHSIETAKERIRELTRQNNRMNRISDAQAGVNRELEERVSKQQDSITKLYDQVESMKSLDYRRILQIFLETIRIFTRTKRASIWCIADDSPEMLSLEATLGWLEEDRAVNLIPLDGSIEGWVFRNKSMFSARMLLQYEHLEKICSGRNIITLPITLGRQVWGVLNIEDMPFEKYNLYTEQLLTIILSLTLPALENAVEYENLIQKEETDTVTGLPLFSQLFRFLDEKIKGPEAKRGYLSLVVLEMMNMDSILQRHGPDAAEELLKEVLSRIAGLTGGRAREFKYKNNNQFAFAFTDLDYDGVGMFCLEALGSISEGGFTISGEEIAVELILGYAVAGESTGSVQELLEEAEHLLEIQKV